MCTIECYNHICAQVKGRSFSQYCFLSSFSLLHTMSKYINRRFCKQNALINQKCFSTPFGRKEQLLEKIRRVVFQP